jgi:hypothetical protein
MNTTLKIILAFLAGALLVCLAAGVVGILLFRATGFSVAGLGETDPERAVNVASESCEYDLPIGFTDAFSVELIGYKLIGYTGIDGHSHIYFLQLPTDVVIDLSDIESEFQKLLPANTGSYRDIRVVATQPGKIAGQEVTLAISEGTNHKGEPFREVSTVFQGKDGQVLVVFSRPTASWNQVEVDRFLESIH